MAELCVYSIYNGLTYVLTYVYKKYIKWTKIYIRYMYTYVNTGREAIKYSM